MKNHPDSFFVDAIDPRLESPALVIEVIGRLLQRRRAPRMRPALRSFGVASPISAARLEIFSGATKIAETDGWGPALASVFTAVGAFALAPSSADAALVLRLSPGAYTAQLSSANNIGDGLIEIYELP